MVGPVEDDESDAADEDVALRSSAELRESAGDEGGWDDGDIG